MKRRLNHNDWQGTLLDQIVDRVVQEKDYKLDGAFIASDSVLEGIGYGGLHRQVSWLGQLGLLRVRNPGLGPQQLQR